MSHDLFTPCHSIVSAAQLLAARDSVVQDSESAFFVQAISSSAALMLGARCSWQLAAGMLQAGMRASHRG